MLHVVLICVLFIPKDVEHFSFFFFETRSHIGQAGLKLSI